MQVADVMTRAALTLRPFDTLREAARIMAQKDVGFMLIGEDDRLVGTLTDRDIAVRAVANGASAEDKVSGYMTRGVRWCFEDDDLDDVLDHMEDYKVRRMPVLNQEKRLVGVVSLGDVALQHRRRSVGDTLRQISEPGGQHSHTANYS